ncbi:hypothetical protein F5B17DRAFT_401175 [Nemania serpens]|nr:hypothetical protein F5B17DRAFT_401175 [Nemania serpens]
MNRREQNNLMDRHNKIMAGILTRFRNMVGAVTDPLPDAAAIPQASLTTMTMNNETAALIKEIENLLALTRDIKKLWIAGPLRKPGDADEQTREKELDKQAQEVSNIYNKLMAMQVENENKQREARQAAAVSKKGKEIVEAKQESGSGGGSGSSTTHIKREDQGVSA